MSTFFAIGGKIGTTEIAGDTTKPGFIEQIKFDRFLAKNKHTQRKWALCLQWGEKLELRKQQEIPQNQVNFSNYPRFY